jgi:hypothetical protein
MRKIHKLAILTTSVAITTLFTAALPVQNVSAEGSSAELISVGRWVSGSGLGGAEISAFDAKSKRIFVTNGATNQIDIVSIKDPKKPVLYGRINLAKKGVTGIQSVATKDGLVAIATQVSTDKAAPGKIFLADVNGKLSSAAPNGIVVGSLPDSVHFSPNGQYIVSADEAEPTSYCLTNGALPTTTDPNGSVSIIDLSAPKLKATVVDFSAFNERKNALIYAGARVFGPNATVAQDLEPEYITISNDSEYAYVTLQENNAIATIDLTTKKVVAVNGLGFKSFASVGLDASDKDSAVKIAPANVFGMYQPDAIAQVTRGETTYLFTANEGDAREWPCLMGGTSTTTLEAEDVRFGKNAASSVDATLKTDAVAGRLKVTPFTPASVAGAPVSGSTSVSAGYSYGARSFSVWQASNVEGVFPLTRVYDSGSSIEQYLSTTRAASFNADWNTTTGLANAVDARSASKGPEPEGLAVGRAYGRSWMVLGLERDGGLMLYDVTNPLEPMFKSYINTSVPTGNMLQSTKKIAAAGDVSPEGILFVSEKESPTGKAMVIVSYELSGTVGIYQFSK